MLLLLTRNRHPAAVIVTNPDVYSRLLRYSVRKRVRHIFLNPGNQTGLRNGGPPGNREDKLTDIALDIW